jgi:hypothetical protein
MMGNWYLNLDNLINCIIFIRCRYDKGTGDRLQGTGNREQGTGNREQGTGNREQVTGDRLQVTGDRLQVTGYRELLTGNRFWAILLFVTYVGFFRSPT